MSRLELVVCDLAGTLIDDGGAVLNAFRLALNAEHLRFEEAELQAVRGANKRAVLGHFAERSLGPGEQATLSAARAYEQFESALSSEYQHGELKPVEGAEPALHALLGSGLKLATNTGFPRSLAALVLGRMGWLEGPFVAHVCGDDVPDGRPAPYMVFLAMQRAAVTSAARVLVAGDTPLDLQAGTNAGAAGVVGVLTGSHGVATLGATRHTHLLPSVAALPALIQAEFS
jgi:phosphonatase-like hydrolase